MKFNSFIILTPDDFRISPALSIMNSTLVIPTTALDHKQTTLFELPAGSLARVLFIKETGDESRITRRLMEMGLIPGAMVRVVKVAPFGCPIEINVRGYHLALRIKEADKIVVTMMDV